MAASSLVDLVEIYSRTTGTGAITLGTAVGGYRGVEALENGATYSYSIQQDDQFETGKGTYLATSDTLVRTPITSSNGGGPINLQPNAAVAFVALAEDILARDVLQPLYGFGPPLSGQGLPGQVYYDLTQPVTLYGPKSATDGWGAGVSLQGEPGTAAAYKTVNELKAADPTALFYALVTPQGLINYALLSGDYSQAPLGPPDNARVIALNQIPSTQGALVIQNAASVYYRGGTSQDVLDDTVNVTTFQATTASDSAALDSALALGAGKTVTLKKKRGGGSWQWTKQHTIPAGTTLVYDGAKSEHSFNGSTAGAEAAAFKLLTGSSIINLNHDCKGAAYPNSRGIVVDETDGNQTLINTNIINAGQPNILFNSVTAGSNFRSTALQMSRSAALTGAGTDNTFYTVEMADGVLAPAAVPRYFTQTNTNGYASFMIGGVNDLHITGGGYLGPMVWSPYSRGVCVNGVRWANQSACTVYGANHAICGNDIAPALSIGSGMTGGGQSKISITGNTMNNPRVVDNSGFSNTNVVQHQKFSDGTIRFYADSTEVNTQVNSSAVYRNGSEYAVDIDMQLSAQAGTAAPSGIGNAATLNVSIPADYQPVYEQFVGPINMTYNGSQKAVFGRLFGSTTGAGLFIRLGYFDAGNFVNHSAATLNAGPITRIRGTFRWTY